MRNTTLCYLEKNGKYLMLYRNKKKNDLNAGKWVGIGGGFEKSESPEECARREIFEETGLHVNNLSFRGIITFDNDMFETEYMFLFTSNDFSGEITDCNEGSLEWIDKNQILSLNLWEGDKYFLELIKEDVPFFSLKLSYKNEKLVGVMLNGEKIK